MRGDVTLRALSKGDRAVTLGALDRELLVPDLDGDLPSASTLRNFAARSRASAKVKSCNEPRLIPCVLPEACSEESNSC